MLGNVYQHLEGSTGNAPVTISHLEAWQLDTAGLRALVAHLGIAAAWLEAQP